MRSLSFLSVILFVALACTEARMDLFERLTSKLEGGFKQKVSEIENVVERKIQTIDVRPWTLLQPAVKQMSIDETKLSGGKYRIGASNAYKPSRFVADAFRWKSCGAADQLIEIRNLTIKPSPLSFPGQLSFGFDIFFHDTITQDAKVTASLKLQIESGGQWIKIPCVGLIGSCDYSDVCGLSQQIQCPDELKQQGIPCSCPFNKGEYKLPNFSIEVDASVFLPGNYQAQVSMSMPEKGQIGCYQVWFSVE